MSLVKIGNTSIKEPSSYNALSADIVKNGRNVKGIGVFDVIRTDVAKIEMSWNYLTCAEWGGILKLFNPVFGGAFINNVTYTINAQQPIRRAKCTSLTAKPDLYT